MSTTGITNILAGNSVSIADEIYGFAMWRSQNDPPWHTGSSQLPRYEGGVVGSTSGTQITLSTTRQAISPSDGSISLETSLTHDHVGRSMMVMKGARKGDVFDILSTSGDDIVVDDSIASISAGDYVAIGDRLNVSTASAQRDIDSLMASCSLNAPTTGDGNFANLQPMAHVLWRKQAYSPTTGSGWVDIGYFVVDGDLGQMQPGSESSSIECRDGLKWLAERPYDGTFQADKIPEHERIGTSSLDCVVLKVVDESGDSGSGMYRFFHSDESDEAKILASHTNNWAVIPPVQLYRSNNQSTAISGTDILLNTRDDAIQILYGSGEVRVQAGFYQDNFTGTDGSTVQPYIKARYNRWATYKDVQTGWATSVHGDTLYDTNVNATAFEFPSAGYGAKGMTLRIISGSGRGQTFTVTGSTATALSCSGMSGTGVASGSKYELGGINAPDRIIEDLCYWSSMQAQDPDLPLYVAQFDPVILPDKVAAAYLYDGSTVDITDSVGDESVTTTLSGSSGDISGFGHQQQYSMLYFDCSGTSPFDGAVAQEYWNGSAWVAIPSYGYVDGTNQWTQSGRVEWNVPRTGTNTWKVSGTDNLYYSRFRVTSSGAGPFTVNRVQVVARPSAQSPMNFSEDDDQVPESIISSLRSQKVIQPNWILYADAAGHIQGKEVVQQDVAAWEYVRQSAFRKERNDDGVYTGVLYRGYSNDNTDIAVNSGSVTINTCAELDAKLSGSSGTPSPTNNTRTMELMAVADTVTGLPLIIDGIDKRDLTRISAGTPTSPGATGYAQRYGWQCRYVSSANNPYVSEANNLPCFYIDLGQSYSDLSEVQIVTDGWVSPHIRWTLVQNQKPQTIFALEVSSDNSSWVPLCDEASAVTMDPDGAKQYVFENSAANWQKQWRYIRYKCVQAGLTASVHNNTISCTGAVIEMRVLRSKEIQSKVWLGDAPFDSAYYTSLLRWYGRRLYVMPDIDYSANTQEAVTERAIAQLRERIAYLPEVTVDGIRPDASTLFETILINQEHMGFTNRLAMITGLTVGLGHQLSVKAQDFTLD